jgi:cation diffusion facilitator family transporter
MNENSVITLDNEAEAISLDELEAKLSNDLEEQLSGLEFLEKERGKINNPKALGETIGNAIWEQFMLQIGSVAGEDFIKSNNNLTLNLTDEAHTQNIEDFKKGIFNPRNSETYKQRYKDYEKNFVLDEQGQIKYFLEGRQKGKPIFKRERRVELFDKGRTKGKNGNAMDHSVPASKMIRDAEAYANLPQEEIVKFANSDQNLNEIPSSLNSAKNDRSIKELIESYEQKGIDISEKTGLKKEEIQRLIDEENKAEKEYKILKETGKKKSVRKSQLREVKRIGKNALRAVLFGLLADFLKVVIKKLVSWFRHAEKKWSTFVDSFKEAWKEFWANFKRHLVNAGKVIGSTILTAILGPIEKIGTILKMGWSSLLNAISYIRDPENRKKPFGILMLEIGKIVVAGLSGAGALFLGEVIEKKLMAAGLMIQIPLLGSLAGIIGMFIGSIVFGIIGALVIRWIDKIIAKRLKDENTKQQIAKQNEILATQEKLIIITDAKLDNTKETVAKSIIERHNKAKEIVEEIANDIRETNNTIDNTNITIDRTNIAINRIDHIINDTEDTIKNISTTMDNEDKETNIESKNIESLNDLFNDLNRL